ncbi:MAG: selenide, water dikinase SelD [Chlorobi bacterium]|nr:selenide, water dikinase SelD [Chlorobiota bacterium]
MIYLDYNATTPIAEEVAEAMRPFLDKYFGNPSSTHSYGIMTKLAVEKARSQIASLINCDSGEIVFTSGGTESNNYAIKGIALANKDRGNHIISSSIEHPAVFEVCEYLAKNGFEITYLPVDELGMVNPEDVEKAIKPTTILISIMHANNEVGTIQPIAEIAEIAGKHKVAFHSDAAQSLGKIAVDVKKLGLDLMSIAGHKLYAPKGIGALYIKNGIKLEKLIHGADHEQNMRAGTENVLEIVGLGKACELAAQNLDKNIEHYLKTRNYLHELLKNEFPEIKLNGHQEQRLPNTLSISFPGIEANTIISRLENVAASAGAACHSESIDVSSVLEAMHIPIEYAMGTIRFSTGRGTNMEDIKTAAKEIIKIVKPLTQTDTEKMTDIKNSVKLTKFTKGGGCACKIKPQKLEKILQGIQPFFNENVLVGTETSDDAAVYKLNEEQAIVQTLDFFTPIVDDPYDFGAIAATNAISDVYAMGAKPLFALNIVGFPEDVLPMEVLQQILKGASDKAAEAGIPILGGHSIEDPEPKYGMVVSGIIHPDKVLKNSNAKKGDLLILTKPLGTGILSSALKRGLIDEKTRITMTEVMKTLNKTSAELMMKYDVHSCTDVTGFGLMGHLKEMTTGSKCNAKVYFDKLNFIDKTKEMVTAGVVPGGTVNNRKYVSEIVDFGELTEIQQLMACDAQTAGGLLIALPADQAHNLLEELHDNGIMDAAIIGEFMDGDEGRIFLV